MWIHVTLNIKFIFMKEVSSYFCCYRTNIMICQGYYVHVAYFQVAIHCYISLLTEAVLFVQMWPKTVWSICSSLNVMESTKARFKNIWQLIVSLIFNLQKPNIGIKYYILLTLILKINGSVVFLWKIEIVHISSNWLTCFIDFTDAMDISEMKYDVVP